METLITVKSSRCVPSSFRGPFWPQLWGVLKSGIVSLNGEILRREHKIRVQNISPLRVSSSKHVKKLLCWDGSRYYCFYILTQEWKTLDGINFNCQLLKWFIISVKHSRQHYRNWTLPLIFRVFSKYLRKIMYVNARNHVQARKSTYCLADPPLEDFQSKFWI